MSRDKGKVFERECAKDLSEATGLEFRRSYGQSREGHDAPDIDAEGWHFWTECTHAAKPNILGKFRQAREASERSGRPPMVIAKQTRGDTLVVMGGDDFLRLVAPKLVMP